MLDIPLRSLNNPFLSIREINDLLTYLKSVDYSGRVIDTKYGTSRTDFPGKNRKIQVRFDSGTWEPYSIFRVYPSEFGADEGFSYESPRVKALGNNLVIGGYTTPGDAYRRIYITNGGEPIYAPAESECEIIGDSNPVLIRFSGETPEIGSRMEMTTGFDDSEPKTIEKNPVGRFVCVSDPELNYNLVWIVAHHDQLSYLPWVQTCVNNDFPIYPGVDGDVFLVRRGTYTFYPYTQPGPGSAIFVPTDPAEYYIAHYPCGYLEEGSIRMMSFDNGYYYLIDPCGIPSGVPSVSSSSRSSSSTVSSSSSSAISSSSSTPSSASSVSSEPSSASSEPSSGSSDISSGSSTTSSDTSSTVSSSSDVGSSGTPCYPDPCVWEWVVIPDVGASWESLSNPCSGAECACSIPSFNGTFNGQIEYTYCYPI